MVVDRDLTVVFEAVNERLEVVSVYGFLASEIETSARGADILFILN
jgi:hypothetical protein